ncbi:hypothetical protein QN277_021782 [Acacia crassicarpa]|uniref:Uncharacterized protein n=1 Tax=Acacia crassicarpa TaxID=499986 RepID=A0AAE1KF18_9FABA|nr:hypothetical protein QN277_021782 [Acacia crassicarpa]
MVWVISSVSGASYSLPLPLSDLHPPSLSHSRTSVSFPLPPSLLVEPSEVFCSFSNPVKTRLSSLASIGFSFFFTRLNQFQVEINLLVLIQVLAAVLVGLRKYGRQS